MGIFLFISVLFFASTDSVKFKHVEGIQPYIFYSENHDQLFFVKKEENISYLKSINEHNRINSYAMIRDHNEDGDVSLHNYHISIAKKKAMVKKESESRPENNKLKFIPIADEENSEKYIVQAPFVRSGLYHLVNDSLLFTIERADTLYMGKNILFEVGSYKVKKELDLFPYSEFPAWANTKENDLLKFKMKAVSDREGTTCAIFLYSSWLLCSSAGNEELFATDQPDQINFPDVESKEYRGTEFKAAPNASDYRVQSIDIAMDDEHIYLLVFGKKINNRSILRAAFSSRRSMDMDKLTTTSDRLYLYDKINGKFLRELTLPYKSRAVTVNDSYIIVVEEGSKNGIRWIPKSVYGL